MLKRESRAFYGEKSPVRAAAASAGKEDKNMAKGKTTVYFCQECGYESAKWMGQCPACHEWNSFVEETVEKKSARGSRSADCSREAKAVPLSQIEMTQEQRVSTGMKELDRVLGGGIVQGSLVLVGGDPGIGKSTLLLQVCRNLAEHKVKVLYISGEESLQQIKIRAERIGTFGDSLSLLCETNLDTIRRVIDREKPEIVVIDSIQTMYNEDVSSAPGSVSQVRESTGTLMQIAKGLGWKGGIRLIDEDVSRRTIAVSIKATKLTGRVLAQACLAVGRKIKKTYRARQTPHGKQTVRQLMGHGAATNSIEVESPKDFDRVARRWNVDYAFYKTGPDKYLLFFKSGQADAITACFSEYSRRVLKRSKSHRVPIREQLKRAAAELARQPSHKKERAREAVHEDR